jgi:eukaryotic-like serine/threonine-protein kinase
MDDDLAREAQKRVGKLLRERWTIDELIGVGGMAAVYKATHRNGNVVAIKILHSDISDNEAIRKRFKREGYVANKIKHPSAVTVFDDDEAEDGAAFLVMELLQGENVESRRERFGGWLPLAEVLAIADQVLDGLAAAHTHGVIHRDINPENLFLTMDGLVKILDFGIARLQAPTSSAELTATGAMIGTPAFMSPEQARGESKNVDAQTDIWCLGATLFTMLTGQIVHEGESLNEVLIYASTKQARSLAALVPDLDPEVVALVDKALRWEKSERWPDARAMQRELRKIADRVLGRSLTGPGEALQLALTEPLSGPNVPSQPEPAAATPRAPLGWPAPRIVEPELPTTPLDLVPPSIDDEAPTDRKGPPRPSIATRVLDSGNELVKVGGETLATLPSRAVAALIGAAALHGVMLALMVYFIAAIGERVRERPAPPTIEVVPATDVQAADVNALEHDAGAVRRRR